MGNFSRDTFDKLKHYVGVRLQQGVPIIDADWNEMEDIRKYELRSFLKWFIGDGVPFGNDGFRITAVDAPNDFVIQGGDGTTDGAGRCLVDGWDVLIENPIRYSEQRLYRNPELAEAWGVTPLPLLLQNVDLTPPGGWLPGQPVGRTGRDRTDTVYLDVWEREVSSAEDSDHLINPAIGIETAVRLKREWVVRVAVGEPEPPPPAEGHVHYTLAHFVRPVNEPMIFESQINDRRQTGLRLMSYEDVNQLTLDAFGADYALQNRGQPALTISLREALNALMKGRLPGTQFIQIHEPKPERPVFGYVPGSFSGTEMSNGDRWLFWEYGLDNRETNIRYQRYESKSNSWGTVQPLTDRSGYDSTPISVDDSDGNVWVFWLGLSGSQRSIWYKRFDSGSGWTDDQEVEETRNVSTVITAAADLGGGIWLFWYSNSHIWSKHYVAGQGWQGSEQRTSSSVGNIPQFSSLRTSNGHLWLFWSRQENRGHREIWLQTYNPNGGGWLSPMIVENIGDTVPQNPTAIEDENGAIWLFWTSNRGDKQDIWYRQVDSANGVFLTSPVELNVEHVSTSGTIIRAFANKQGIYVFWRPTYSSTTYVTQYDPNFGWGTSHKLEPNIRSTVSESSLPRHITLYYQEVFDNQNGSFSFVLAAMPALYLPSGITLGVEPAIWQQRSLVAAL